MTEVGKKKNVLELFKNDYEKRNEQKTFSVSEYLDLCKEDKQAYASAAERLLAAIGDAKLIETKDDSVLSRVFKNKAINRYDTFSDFYGMEETIMKIANFLKKASQGLEESKQVLYLLGPVGSAKSSLAEKLKELMQEKPFYTIKSKKTGEISPVNESPLGLFDKNKFGKVIEEEYGIPSRYLRFVPSPWASKRLKEAGGDMDAAFEVVKIYPSVDLQLGIGKTTPGDSNTQDISDLVGKVDLRKLEEFEEKDPDAYSYSGALCHGNRGIMEFVEMFKADIKTLNPILTATQEGNFNGTEAIGSVPFDGVILAHSNESEWSKFSNNKDNEAFLDRVFVVKVPYSLRVSEEQKIYEKYINRESSLGNDKVSVAPQTLETMAKFSVLTRLVKPENSSVYSKMRVYDGETLKDIDPNAKTISEYRNNAGNHEGMEGFSTRSAFKALSETFNAVAGKEPSADPVHLMQVLEETIDKSELPDETKQKYKGFIGEYLEPDYLKFLDKEIKEAYLDDNGAYGQSLFNRYFDYAECWLDERNYIDPETTHELNKEALEEEMEKTEKFAKISNPKDFRSEFVRFVLRHKVEHDGEMPSWKDYSKVKKVIEARVFSTIDNLLPVISFGSKANDEDAEKHGKFVKSMKAKGYTEDQVRFLGGWYTSRSANM